MSEIEEKTPDIDLEEPIKEETLNKLEAEIRETAAEAGVTEETEQAMIDNIDWSIVQYEDPEEYIPVFSEEEWDTLRKYGEMSPRPYIEMHLNQIREKKKYIFSEEFAMLSKDEQLKELKDINHMKKLCIGMVQESVRHYKELFTKENINQLTGYILSEVVGDFIREFGSIRDKDSKYDECMYTVLLNSASNMLKNRSVYEHSYVQTVTNGIVSYGKFVRSLKNLDRMPEKDEIIRSVMSLIRPTMNVVNMIIRKKKGSVESPNEDDDKLADYLLKHKQDARITQIEYHIDQLKEKIVRLSDKAKGFREDIKTNMLDTGIDYIKKRIKNDALSKKESQQILEMESFIERVEFNLYRLTDPDFNVDEYINTLIRITFVDVALAIVGKIYSGSKSYDGGSTFTPSVNVEFNYIMSLVNKYTSIDKIGDLDDNVKLTDVYSDNDELKKDIDALSTSDDFSKGVKALIFNNETPMTFYTNILEFINGTISRLVGDIEDVINTNVPVYYGYVTGPYYAKIAPKSSKNVKKKKKR